MRKVLKGKRFADVEEVKQKMAEVLNGVKTSSNTALKSGKSLNRCVASNGKDFEGD